MASTGFRGVDVRQAASATALVVRASLKDSSGARVTAGTTSLYLYEYQSDGTLKSYDFNDNTFKATALTTETLGMTARNGNNGTRDTGVWTAALATLTGFTAGAVYLAVVENSGAFPPQQEREFQYGQAEGDLSMDAAGVVVSNVTQVNGTAVDPADTLPANVVDWAGVAVTAGAVPNAAAGAAGGLLIAGSNAATSIAGLTLAGAAASGGTPATAGLTVTGGSASTTSGGTSAAAATFVGGAGAATTNGAAAGVTMTGGGTTTVSGGAGLSASGTGALAGLLATGGTSGGAGSGPGVQATRGGVDSDDLILTNSDAPTLAAALSIPANFGVLAIDVNGRVKIQSGVPKNTALDAFQFFLASFSDHVSPATGATVTAQRSLDGAAFGACANAAAEVGSGMYKIDLAAADLNGNTVTLKFSAAGADTRVVEIVTTP